MKSKLQHRKEKTYYQGQKQTKVNNQTRVWGGSVEL